MNAVIVDDEPLAREGIANYVREVDFLHLVATVENPVELMTILDHTSVDLLFLDIQMPKMSGIDFLKIAKKPPMVIITTAYPSFALEGFRLNVLDYLLKPITFERFMQAAQKAKEQQQLIQNKESLITNHTDDYFFIKCESKYEKIYFRDILYIQGMQNYVAIYTEKGKYITLLSLKQIAEKLNATSFIRVHKSYIIAISKIDSVESHEIRIQATAIPLSRTYREEVIHRVVDGKLWKKK